MHTFILVLSFIFPACIDKFKTFTPYKPVHALLNFKILVKEEI